MPVLTYLPFQWSSSELGSYGGALSLMFVGLDPPDAKSISECCYWSFKEYTELAFDEPPLNRC